MQVAEFLEEQVEVKKVYYPAFVDREHYDAVRRPDGGFGGLISFSLTDPSQTPALYEAMRFCKGPSLGTDYTLVCPYTLLAHYREIKWAESCGVSAELLRISVGRESEIELLGRLEEAFEAIR